jgi:hypothetical protein
MLQERAPIETQVFQNLTANQAVTILDEQTGNPSAQIVCFYENQGEISTATWLPQKHLKSRMPLSGILTSMTSADSVHLNTLRLDQP